MRVSMAFLAGFTEGDDGPTLAISVGGNEDSITFTKGPALFNWLTNETAITTAEGETVIKDENMRRVQLMLAQWLRGEEPNPE